MLLWINYASQILFFGAEFTKVYANRFGSHIEPEAHAQQILPEHRAAQGIKPDPTQKGASHARVEKNGATDASIEGGALPSDKNLNSAEKLAKIAELRAENKKSFEFSMAVVAGALMAVVFALKKRETDNHRELRRLNEKQLPPRLDAQARNPRRK